MSSDSNVFVDLTSSPGSSPRPAVRGAPATVSTIDLADPSLDRAGVRASLGALQQSIDQVEALREHRSDHANLRREFLVARRRAEDLDRQLTDAANAASPYTKLAECLDALQERFDNSHELEACRLRYRDLKVRYDEAVSEFQDRISTLEAQLAAASSFGVIVPPDTAHHIADLESQLTQSQIDLQVARNRQSALASELARSTSSLSQANAPGHAPVSTSPIELLPTAAAGQRATRSMSSSSSAGPPGHLHRSVRSAAKSGGGGASSLPAAPEAIVHSDSGESSSGASSSTHVFDSDAAGNDNGSPESSRAKNEFGMPSGPLSDADLAALQPTTVPRSEWIPGYRDRRSFRGHDIVPWSAQDIRQICIVEMDADLLFHHYTKPMDWLIPLRDPAPPLGDWRDDLVDESNVRDLIETAPWEILAAP
ncbi:hypothetical protein F441_22260 [Phytophthora nicotianae CJ01A1]|uniref:Autophagy-related protein 16 domain-containing protein n=1 Tax=Phytophthora nicotianae CJ01A1 TaxID=1317063 RepID=W2VPZ5_PHYNI|nr:hypothetical protein F441_22260 [Phytophthora nicotianae CJ01A1]